jgi:hypothetical protein
MKRDIVELTEDHKSNGKLYKKGHRFKVIGSSFRGLDIEDSEGNRIYETLFIDHILKPVPISELRDDKLNQLGI